jgi:sulfite reductase beta subunit-like hemoprotein
MLGVCEGTIDNYRDNGRLKVTHKGRRILIPIAEVERLAAEDDPGRVRPVDPPARKPVASVKNPKPLNKPKQS